MATIALACLYNSPDVVIDERTLIDMEKELKKRQFRNGTVENLKTTALVVQVKHILKCKELKIFSKQIIIRKTT